MRLWAPNTRKKDQQLPALIAKSIESVPQLPIPRQSVVIERDPYPWIPSFPCFPWQSEWIKFFASPLPTWLQIQFSKDRNCRCFHQSISLPGSTLGLHDWKVFLPDWCWGLGYWKYRFLLSFPVLRLNRPFFVKNGFSCRFQKSTF